MARTAFVHPSDAMHSSRKTYTFLDPEVVECITRSYAMGKPITDIVAGCGVSSISTIYDIVDAAGLPRRRKRFRFKESDIVSVGEALADCLSGRRASMLILSSMPKRVYFTCLEARKGTLEAPSDPEVLRQAAYMMELSTYEPGNVRMELSNMTPEEIHELQKAVHLIDHALPRRIRTRKLWERKYKLIGAGRNPVKRAKKYGWVRALARAMAHGVQLSPIFLAWILGVNPESADYFIRNILLPYSHILAN